MHTLPSARARFGAFELDLSTGELRSVEAPEPKNQVILREQVFQVLRMLLEREGKIVTGEEIKEGLWAKIQGHSVKVGSSAVRYFTNSPVPPRAHGSYSREN